MSAPPAICAMPDGGAFAVGDGVHDFAAAIHAIAAGKIFRIGGLAGLAD